MVTLVVIINSHRLYTYYLGSGLSSSTKKIYMYNIFGILIFFIYSILLMAVRLLFYFDFNSISCDCNCVCGQQTINVCPFDVDTSIDSVNRPNDANFIVLFSIVVHCDIIRTVVVSVLFHFISLRK